MDLQDYWRRFLLSGDPAAYLEFHNARKEAEEDVHENPGPGAPGGRI